jgi:hypothetical protein
MLQSAQVIVEFAFVVLIMITISQQTLAVLSRNKKIKQNLG